MQPIGHRRRSWNWQRLLKKARGGLVAALVSVPLLLFIGVIYIVMLFERFFGVLFRTAPGSGRHDRKTLSGAGNASHHGKHRVSTPLSRGLNGLTALPIVAPPFTNDQDAQGTLADAEERSRTKVDRAILSNLALCRTPTAVNAVVEEAVLRKETRWPVIEEVFDRLVFLNANSNDVRLLMRTSGYDWLYQMQIKPRRFIQLKPEFESGKIRWQHIATRLICYEFDGRGDQPDLLPPFDLQFSQTRIFFYFDDQKQLLGWERPSEPRRRSL